MKEPADPTILYASKAAKLLGVKDARARIKMKVDAIFLFVPILLMKF